MPYSDLCVTLPRAFPRPILPALRRPFAFSLGPTTTSEPARRLYVKANSKEINEEILFPSFFQKKAYVTIFEEIQG